MQNRNRQQEIEDLADKIIEIAKTKLNEVLRGMANGVGDRPFTIKNGMYTHSFCREYINFAKLDNYGDVERVVFIKREIPNWEQKYSSFMQLYNQNALFEEAKRIKNLETDYEVH